MFFVSVIAHVFGVPPLLLIQTIRKNVTAIITNHTFIAIGYVFLFHVRAAHDRDDATSVPTIAVVNISDAVLRAICPAQLASSRIKS